MTPFSVRDPSEPDGLVCVARFGSPRAAAEHGLVVLAMGLTYWLDDSASGFGVLVERDHAAAVRQELALYDQANENWPPPQVKLGVTRLPFPWFTPLLWAAIVVWVFRLQLLHWHHLVEAGALDARALFTAGEWWRPFTALFLHADVGHLVGNVVIGVFVFSNVVAATGVLRAWRDLFASAIVANVAAAALHFAPGIRSLGASTMIFAGLGWLTGRAVRAGWGAGRRRWSRAVGIPLAAGVVLLAWLGGGGDLSTDVIAHAAGFLSGLVTGVVRGPTPSRRS